MTTLSSITDNHLSLTCKACGHSALVAVAGLLNTITPDTTVQQVRQQARCSHCKVKDLIGCQIVFVGNSAVAFNGRKAQ